MESKIGIITHCCNVVGTTDIKNKTVGDMMDAFKSITSVEYIRGVKNLNWKPFNGKIWQRDTINTLCETNNPTKTFLITLLRIHRNGMKINFINYNSSPKLK